MADDRLSRVWAEARAERSAEVGWEPADWGPILRRRRLAEWRSLGLFAAVLIVVASVRTFVLERPIDADFWLPTGLFLLLAADTSLAHATAELRAQWEEKNREEVRVEHALREHVSIGAQDREQVTALAKTIRSWAPVVFLAWPVLGVLVIGTVLDLGDLSVVGNVAVSAVVVLVCAWRLRVRWWRLRLARRWLADPLPPPTPARPADTEPATRSI